MLTNSMPQSPSSEAISSPAAQEINSPNKLTGISVTDTSNPYNYVEAKKKYGKRDMRLSQQS